MTFIADRGRQHLSIARGPIRPRGLAAGTTERRAVFLNVPYDKRYEPFFVTLVGTLVCLGQTPHCVLEVPEDGAGRLERIFEVLRSCRVSIHDLTRTGVPARFNMPFELGIAFGLAFQGAPHQIVVMDCVRHRLDRTLSDYKGRDPLIYRNLGDLVGAVSDALQVDNEPTPEVLRDEARILRASARRIAERYGGTIFRRAAFRALVAAATERAEQQGLISP